MFHMVWPDAPRFYLMFKHLAPQQEVQRKEAVPKMGKRTTPLSSTPAPHLESAPCSPTQCSICLAAIESAQRTDRLQYLGLGCLLGVGFLFRGFRITKYQITR